MPQQQCIFCQLLDNPQQTFVVHETEDFKAWLDINPRARGHCLVIPKDHMESAEEVDGLLPEMFDVARIVGEKAVNGIGADGYSVVMNSGKAAGQKMDHFYMIVFPRFEDEETAGTPTGAIFPPMEDMEKSEIQGIHEKMAEAGFNDYGSREKTEYEKMKEERDDGGEASTGFRREDGAEFR